MKSFLKTLLQTCLCILLALFVCGALLCIGVSLLLAPPNIVYEKTKFPVTEKVFKINAPIRFTNLPAKLVKDNWTSYTTGVLGDGIRAMAFDKEGFLWTVGSGGAVRWNLKDQTYTKYTTEHGVVTNNLFSVSVAPDGVVWVGGESGGISTFDGKDWKVYNLPDLMWTNEIHVFYFETDQLIWAGVNEKGLFHYDGHGWSRTQDEEGPGYENVSSIFKASDDSLWVGIKGRDKSDSSEGHGGVYRFDGNHWKHFQYEDGLMSKVVVGITEFPAGTIWVATGSGLARYDGKNWVNITSDNGFIGGSVSSMILEYDQAIWLGTEKGLSRFDGKNWENIHLNHPVKSLIQSADGEIWFSSDDGLHSISNENIETYLTEDFILDNGIIDLGIDKNSNIWCRTLRHPLLMYEGTTSQAFDMQDGLPDNLVLDIRPVRDGVWIGTDNGISFYSNTKWESYFPSGKTCNRFEFIYEDQENKILTACKREIFKFDGFTWNSIIFTGNESTWGVNGITSTPDGSIWVATYGGIYKFNGKTWIEYPQKDGKFDLNVEFITSDQKGNIWALSGDEIVKFDGVEWKNINNSGKYFFLANDMIAMNDDSIWNPTFAGAYQLNTAGKLKLFTTSDGLGSNVVWNVQEAPDGSLWFATEGGLSRYKEP